ncbi:hypothetical protein ACWPKO_12555 [Coraliomargarita sp. W4R53]
MKTILTTTLLLASSALLTEAAQFTFTMDGGNGSHRHGSGLDNDNDGIFDKTLHTGAGKPYLHAGYQRSDSGQVRRAMMKWDLSTIAESLVASSEIKSAILNIHVSQNKSAPFSNLWIGQDLSITTATLPSQGNFNEGLQGGFFTGITPALVSYRSEVEHDIDITEFVRKDFDHDSDGVLTTLIFYLEHEDDDFTNTTAQYLIGASGAYNAATLTIITAP